jgi:predicted nucleic-acid-binding protein
MADHEKFSPKAKAFMVKVSQEKTKAEIPAVVIVECVYVMEKFYRIPKHEIADTLSRILNFSGIVNPDKSEILEALLKYEASNGDIVDCLLAASSSPDKVVVSFDKDFAKLKATTEFL